MTNIVDMDGRTYEVPSDDDDQLMIYTYDAPEGVPVVPTTIRVTLIPSEPTPAPPALGAFLIFCWFVIVVSIAYVIVG